MGRQEYHTVSGAPMPEKQFEHTLELLRGRSFNQAEVDKLLEVIQQSAASGVHVDKTEQELISYFRSEAGHPFGIEGDHRGWKPIETTKHFLSILAADSHMRHLETNIKQFRHSMNTILDRTQRRFNEVFREDVGSTKPND